MGIKKLAWRSVEQNRLPKRPELFAMTGGYRRIPVMQIGADIYCDTQCILRELECRIPAPTFFPNNGAGLPFALSRWTDGPLFDLVFCAGFAPIADTMPPEWVADRTRLYLGPHGDLGKLATDLPHILAQLRAQLGWLDDRFGSGRRFVLGEDPGMPDLLAWYIIWFLRARYTAAEQFLSEFPALLAWADRMKSIGHGTMTPMTPADALAIAKASEPQTAEKYDPRDAQGLKPGQRVTVQPITDSGDPAVSGIVRAVDRNTIALTRESPECGQVAIHFPRVGYRVTIA